jgi:hypothetical protein
LPAGARELLGCKRARRFEHRRNIAALIESRAIGIGGRDRWNFGTGTVRQWALARWKRT